VCDICVQDFFIEESEKNIFAKLLLII